MSHLVSCCLLRSNQNGVGWRWRHLLTGDGKSLENDDAMHALTATGTMGDATVSWILARNPNDSLRDLGSLDGTTGELGKLGVGLGARGVPVFVGRARDRARSERSVAVCRQRGPVFQRGLI